MESHKNLVDQCVQGEGLVQINVQIKPMQKRINIVDVLKPADDFIEIVENCMYKCICLFFCQNDFTLINNIFVCSTGDYCSGKQIKCHKVDDRYAVQKGPGN